jgi:crotonobetainyl-CoA:carnitine CoA-transferase CaiB-like acyl-CoA transferase
MEQSNMPLSGVKVIELAQILAGPVAGQILGDLGADVIKVERPDGGDDFRQWTPPTWHGTSAGYLAANRNKRSVTLDLRDPDDRERFLDLIRDADIFIQNLRPGALDKMGLGAEALMAVNPRLIYCDLTGFGHVGPLRDKPAYEVLLQAFCGIMALNGEPGGPPMRSNFQVCDMGTAMWTALGAVSALRQRDATGKGCVINTSLLESALFWLNVHYGYYQAAGKMIERHPNGSARLVVFQAFDTKDGVIEIAASSDRLFAKLAVALGHTDWAENEQYKTNAGRMQDRSHIIDSIQEILLTQTTGHWSALFDAAGVPSAPINELPEAVAHAQTEALGIVQKAPGMDANFISMPMSFDGARPAIRRRPPELGEHNDEVFGAAREPAAGDD